MNIPWLYGCGIDLQSAFPDNSLVAVVGSLVGVCVRVYAAEKSAWATLLIMLFHSRSICLVLQSKVIW